MESFSRQPADSPSQNQIEKDSQQGMVVRPLDNKWLAELDPKIAKDIKQTSIAAEAEKLLNIADVAISHPSNIQKAKATYTLQQEWKALSCVDKVEVTFVSLSIESPFKGCAGDKL